MKRTFQDTTSPTTVVNVIFELIIDGLHLRCNKAMVNSFTVQQILVRALLHHAPVMSDSYDVSILDGG